MDDGEYLFEVQTGQRARNERFREGYGFRRVFGCVVDACMAAGLVRGEGLAADSSRDMPRCRAGRTIDRRGSLALRG